MKVNGKLIQIARTERGWTQQELADVLKRHVATISRLEHGHASVHVAHDAAKLLGLRVEDLLTVLDTSCVCNTKQTD